MATAGLFDPIHIKHVEIPNRIALAPMNVTYSTQDGYATQQDMAHLARRAQGGFGLIITGAVIATKLAAPFVYHRNLYLYDESFVPGLNMMVQACHNFGAKIFCQLSVGFGRQGHALDGRPSPAPSRIPLERSPERTPKGIIDYMIRAPGVLAETLHDPVPREMTIEEIKDEVYQYAMACRKCVYAGFDGIEIHAPHGYLEHQFLSPRSNKRTDMYGGSLENRMRFLLEVTQMALMAVGNAVPVGIRMSAQEHMPDGITIDEVKIVVKRLEDLGVAYLQLSDGSYEALDYMFPGSIKHVEEHLLREAKEIKSVLKIPIIVPGVNDRAIAEKAIAEGVADMISLGRGALADPDWPNKVKAGKKVTECKRDCMCLIGSLVGLSPRCTVNPELGYEQYDPDLFPKKRVGPTVPSALTKLPPPPPPPHI
ncbi:MAG: NADH:flavin oxidoreductase [Dehalococcoidia bacterium]|nr:NADH:flavin oxidoreductase [Dehalococcoidia bacterium]MDD5493482.1 NADH:flavin oxidoreductase [Dehalococcoidia bacterium]